MQGLNIVAYPEGELDSEFKRPLDITPSISSWAPTRKQARKKKREMEQKYGGIVEIKPQT